MTEGFLTQLHPSNLANTLFCLVSLFCCSCVVQDSLPGVGRVAGGGGNWVDGRCLDFGPGGNSPCARPLKREIQDDTA